MDKERDILTRILSHFLDDFSLLDSESITTGIINRTYKAITDRGNFLVQTINTKVFSDPGTMMDNIDKVTSHIRKKNAEMGLVDSRHNIIFLKDRQGKNYCVQDGEYWRVSNFIDNSASYDDSHSPFIMEKTGKAFGRFAKQLSDIDMSTLKETIPGFHDTEKRIRTFYMDLEGKALPERKEETKKEIDLIAQWKDQASELSCKARNGLLPLRVTHNDTKTNNILFDRDTKEFLAIIDLDTVMPGLIAYDFADAIRFSANTAAEDEPDASKASLDISLFEAFARGYLSEAGDFLTEDEVDSLVKGTLTITFEQGLRFLGDYLAGDTYYQISRPLQNRDRARCQFALLEDMLRKSSQMEEIIERQMDRRRQP